MGVLITLLIFFSWKEPSSLAQQQKNLSTPPMEATPWTPCCKIEKYVFPNKLPFQFIYMRVELWANHMG